MKQMSLLKTSLIATVATLGLAACGGGGDNNFTAPPTGVVTPVVPTPPPTTPPPPPPPPGAEPQDQAGAGFAAAFNQGDMDEPTDPVDGDIIPLDKTGEPIPIP